MSAETDFSGQACVKLEVTEGIAFPCAPVLPPFYFYESNDSVFYARETDSVFRLAYDFGAGTGDGWLHLIPVETTNSIDTFNVEVLAVNQITIDGHILKELVLKYTKLTDNSILEIYPDEISVIETVGATSVQFVPLGKLGSCDFESTVNIQCFHSPSVQYVNPQFGTCTVSAPTVQGESEMVIYPNPANNAIVIKWPGNEKGIIRIIQLDGKVVSEQTWRSDAGRITLPSLSCGMYIVEVLNGENRYFKKLQID